MKELQITSVSSKGQVVIPNNIRQSLGISTGVKFFILTDGSNLLLKPITSPKLETFDKLIKQSAKLVKTNSKIDISKLIKKVRNENRP